MVEGVGEPVDCAGADEARSSMAAEGAGELSAVERDDELLGEVWKLKVGTGLLLDGVPRCSGGRLVSTFVDG